MPWITGTASPIGIHHTVLPVRFAGFDSGAGCGQALIGSVFLATSAREASMPLAGFSGSAGRPVIAASRATPSAPPGGHWLMSASPAATASA